MQPDPRDSFELSSRPLSQPPAPNSSSASPSDTPQTGSGGGYLRVYFSCSNTYTRAQKSAAGDSYTARCAQCGQCKRFVVGTGGTSQRSFVLSCS
ncbi:MAG: hypothetical protein QM783_14750 [Phycisphaerales bacterium]